MYRKPSIYQKTNVKDRFYLDIWNPLTITPSVNDKLIKIPSRFNLRPDLAAYELYGDPKLWFVFYLRNPDKLKTPFWDFTEGLEINIPGKDIIRKQIL
jgi:hypothetical protein